MGKLYNKFVSALHARWHHWRERRQLTKARKNYDNCMTWRCINYQYVYAYTPTYNRREILFTRAIPTVEAQTHRQLSHFVVDDGSTDDTMEWIMNRGVNDENRVIYLPSKRRLNYPQTPEGRWLCGPVNPANTFLKFLQFKLDWIARLDDDDEWCPTHLEECIDYAIKNNLEFVSAYSEEERNGEKRIVKEDASLPGIGATQTWVYRSYLSFFRYDKSCWRKAWNRVNDTDLAERMRNAGVRMGQVPRVHAYIRPRPGNTQVGLKAYTEESE